MQLIMLLFITSNKFFVLIPINSIIIITRRYLWGIQSPHTSTAVGGGGVGGVLGKLRFELRKES